MQKKLIFLLVFMVLIAVFALQNSVEVEIKLWFWSVKTSMVLVLLLTFAAGAIAGLLFSLPRRPRTRGKENETDPDPIHKPDSAEKEKGGSMDEFEDLRR